MRISVGDTHVIAPLDLEHSLHVLLVPLSACNQLQIAAVQLDAVHFLESIPRGLVVEGHSVVAKLIDSGKEIGVKL